MNINNFSAYLFLVLFGLVCYSLIRIILNLIRKKDHQNLLEWLAKNDVSYVEIKNLKTDRFNNIQTCMSKCDLIFLDDALIILGVDNHFIPIKSTPVIFTKNISFYLKSLKFALVYNPEVVNLDSFSNSIHFEFGKGIFGKYNYVLRIHDLESDYKQKIKKILE